MDLWKSLKLSQFFFKWTQGSTTLKNGRTSPIYKLSGETSHAGTITSARQWYSTINKTPRATAISLSWTQMDGKVKTPRAHITFQFNA